MTSDGTYTYGWHAEGNLITVSGVTGTFDALGRRLEVDISGTYEQMVYPPFAPTYQMALATGLTAAGIRMPLPGGGEAIFNSTGLAQYRHPNWQGSQVVLSWPSGSPNPNVGGAFTPFGEKYAIYPGGFNGFFAGMLGIADEGAIQYAYQATARLMQQEAGRWLSPDPAGLSAVDLSNPQTMNRYVYVANNPLSYTDPSGLDPHQCPSGQTWVQNQNGDGGHCVAAGSLTTSTFVVITNCAQAALMYPGLVNCGGGVPTYYANSFASGGGAVGGVLSSIKSFFGYDSTDSRPSCFGGFLGDVGSGMSPFPTSAHPLDNISDISKAAATTGEIYYFNKALNYAATRPSATFKTAFLMYPNKSTVFSGIMQRSATLAKIGGKVSFWASLLYSEGSALVNEFKSIQAGTCQ